MPETKDHEAPDKEIFLRELQKRHTLLLSPDDLEREFSNMIKSLPSLYHDVIREAAAYAKQKHAGQYRESNTLYFTHCLDTAINAMENGAGAQEVLISLLHDTIEDTDATHEELKEKFGAEVTDAVWTLSKIRNGQKIPDEEYYAGIAAQPSLVRIKGCDRLSNVTSMHLAPKWSKRERYILSTERDIIPFVKKVDPALAEKIQVALDFARENPLPNEVNQKRLEVLGEIRKASEVLK